MALQGLVTQVCPVGGPPDAFVTLKGHESCQLQTEFSVSLLDTTQGSAVAPWRRMRILPADHAGESASRLSIRHLRLFGKVEVSALQPDPGHDVLASWRKRRI